MPGEPIDEHDCLEEKRKGYVMVSVTTELSDDQALRLIMGRLNYSPAKAQAWLASFKRRHGSVQLGALMRAITSQRDQNAREFSTPPPGGPSPDIGPSFGS